MKISTGPADAKIMLVGEFPTQYDRQLYRPFQGQEGGEVSKMLMEVGINKNDCFQTNLCHETPPKGDMDNFFFSKTEGKALNIAPIWGKYPHAAVSEGLAMLAEDIEKIQPKLIIAFGAYAMWALTGNSAIMNWRGSALYYDGGNALPKIPVLPTISPTNILRDWTNRFLAVHDLRRAKRCFDEGGWPEPNWRFIVRPTFDQAMDWMGDQLARGEPELASDIETRKGQIACVGMAPDSKNAICIPFMQSGGNPSYWNEQEELAIILRLRDLQKKALNTFQNGAYDAQYFALQWGYVPRVEDDTMIMQHIAFAGLRKSLAMIASLYCDYYRYWKDDGKTWREDENDEQQWRYNCEDCVRTFESAQALRTTLKSLNLEEQYHFQMKELWPQVLRTMLRGVRVDFSRRMELDFQLEKQLSEIQEWLNTSIGHPINPRSPLKMKQLFYEDLNIPVRRNRKTGNPSLDDENLTKIGKNYPLFAPLVQKILDFRSVGVFLSTFVRAAVPPDGRMRCTYNVTGTETYRFSSSADAFAYGTNLQNIPAGDEA